MEYQDHLKYVQNKKSGPSLLEIQQRIFIQKSPLWAALKIKQQDKIKPVEYLEIKEN